jgi:hypothetical protein
LGRQDEAMVTREQVSNAWKQKARIMNELGRPESGGQ